MLFRSEKRILTCQIAVNFVRYANHFFLNFLFLNGNGKQFVFYLQKWDVLDALELSKAGKSAKEIKEILEANKLNASIYITVNTLDYLRKGGRITPAVAILGGMMKIKPILQIQGEKLDTFSKTRTMSKATKIMMEAIKKDIDERLDPEGKGKNVHVCIAYTYDEQPALELKKELEAIYPDSTIICVKDANMFSWKSAPTRLHRNVSVD